MWSDNDIDEAFQRLQPPGPEPGPFPLDAWLRLQEGLDKAAIEHAVRQKLWRYFATEVAVVALVALGWLLWLGTTAKPAAVAGSALPPAAAMTATPRPTHAAATQVRMRASATVPVSSRPSPSEKTVPAGTDAGTTTSSLPTEQGLALPGQASSRLRGSAGSAGRPQVALAAGAADKDVPHARQRRRRRTGTTTAIQSRTSFSGYANNSTKTDPVNGLRLGHDASTLRRSGAKPTSEALEPNAFPRRRAVFQRPVAAQQKRTTSAGSSALGEAAAVDGRRPFASRQATAVALATNGGTAARPEPELRPTTAASHARLEPLPSQVTALNLPGSAPLPTPLRVAPSAKVPPPVVVRQPRLYVGLVGAPDVTTVKFKGVESPTLNVGALVEYRLGNRWRVSSGVLRSTKHYVARREDYDWGAYASRVYQRDFTDVDGSCTVLDVPLNLRYDLVVRASSRVYGSAGMSSFFMQKERYAYAYIENNTAKLWERRTVNENRHFFSIVNASVGYEHSLGGQWSLQAEPYVKIPLAGVGAGKVRLTSGGLFLAVKYGL